jgi:hypothetical protein
VFRGAAEGIKREEAKTSTGVGSRLSELGGSIVSGDVNSSVNAIRRHAADISRNALRVALSRLSTAQSPQAFDSLQQASADVSIILLVVADAALRL